MQPETKVLTCRSLLRVTRNKDEQCPYVERLRQALSQAAEPVCGTLHTDPDPCPELPTSDKAELLAGTAECH